MWRDKVLTFCLILCLGVSYMGRLFSVSAAVSQSDQEYLDGLTAEEWITGAELANMISTGGNIEVGSDTIDLSKLSHENSAWLTSSGGHRFASRNQELYIQRELENAELEGRSVNMDDFPLTMQDISDAIGFKPLMSYGYVVPSDDAPSQYADFLEQLGTASLFLTGLNCYAPGYGDLYSYQYNFNVGEHSYISNERIPVNTGVQGVNIQRGAFDLYSRNVTTLLPYYTPQSGYDLWESPDSEGYSEGDYLNSTTTSRRIALLIPSDPTLDSNCVYSNGILQYIHFGTEYDGPDNIRFANDITTPIDDNTSLYFKDDISFTYYDGSFTTTQNMYIGSRWYSLNPGNDYITAGLYSYGGPRESWVYTAFDSNVDPNPTFDDVTKILNYLPGYFRNVDVYIGVDWDNCTPLTGGSRPKVSVKPPQELSYITTPSTGTINLNEFMLFLRQYNNQVNYNITINIIPGGVYTPPPTDQDPDPTEAPKVTEPPVAKPTPGDIAIYPPYNPPPNEFPLWGDGDDMPNSDEDSRLFSLSVGRFYGITPAPTRNGTETVTLNGSAYEDVAEEDSATSVATGLVELGSALFGPVMEIVWYCVGITIVVALIVKILHN